MRRSHRNSLAEMFVRGETARLIALPLSTFKREGRPELLVGALVLTGDFERAAAVGRGLETKDSTGIVAFYLSLGFARAGRYKEAQKRIDHLDSQVRSLKSRETLQGLHSFYLSQSRGFYDFARGDSVAAVEHSRQALAAAEASKDQLQPLARTLSLDLLGHSLVRNGFARRGLKTLRLAAEAARMAKHESFEHAISVSILKYEAVFGLEPRRVLSRLSRALIELKPNDSYSRSELRLELARQLLLRGCLAEARRHLESAATEILGTQNRLQTAALHLRLAWMARLEGRGADALLSLQSADIGLRSDESGDLENRELLVKISFFRLSLLQELGRSREARELEKNLSPLAGSRGLELRLTNRRFSIQSGESSTSASALAAGEDPFGDLMDRVHRGDRGVETDLLDHGYFGLLLPLFGLHLAQTSILIGAPGQRVVVVDRGEARQCENGLKGLLGKLILRVAHGPCTRREAIESVWGYTYEANRHDRLLAVAASRIRKVLGGERPWIELQGDRVVLRDQVVVRFWSRALSETSLSLQIPAGATPPGLTGEQAPIRNAQRNTYRNTAGLRIRQLQVLNDLVTRGDIGVQDIVERFGVSRASALRDLGELVARDFLVRTGETRATRYMLADTW